MMLEGLHGELAYSLRFEGKAMIQQQDSASSHFRSYLDANFPDWTGRRGKIDWPP